MRNLSILSPGLALLLCVLSPIVALPATGDRIPQAIEKTATWKMRGNVTPRARSAYDRGSVDAALPLQGMKLVFKLTPAQQSSLDQLLEQQQNPASANYHKWLTPEQYADRFGLSGADVQRTAQWLRQQGFGNVMPARSRTWISFSGSATQVESAIPHRD